MRFVPDENKIEIRAYSPVLKETMEDDGYTFNLPYDMTPQAAAAREGVPAGNRRRQNA